MHHPCVSLSCHTTSHVGGISVWVMQTHCAGVCVCWLGLASQSCGGLVDRRSCALGSQEPPSELALLEERRVHVSARVSWAPIEVVEVVV